MQTKERGIFLLRVVLGFGFLFAGMHKFLGGTFSAKGFLNFATFGTWIDNANDGKVPAVINPTHGIWTAIAGNPGLVSVINFLVVFGEIAIGAALILGLATRFAGVMGALMLGLFAIASWDFQNGFVNEQVLYAVSAAALALTGAGAYALDSIVSRLAITERVPALRYLVS